MSDVAKTKGGNILTKMMYFPIEAIANNLSNTNRAKQLEGEITVEFPNGTTIVLGNGDTSRSKACHVKINNFRGLMRVFTRASLGFAEAYMNGDIEVSDLLDVFNFCVYNRQKHHFLLTNFTRRYSVTRIFHHMRRNTKAGSRKNIREHYDLGNDFYSNWLDDSMTYSSAYFDSDSSDLKDAQHNKYQRICDHIGLPSAESILEIGCGWGGFAEYAAEKSDAKITAISISNSQIDFARKRMENKNLSDQVEIKFQDYRDTQGKFDAIVSIEMIEAVGEEYWPVYFKTLRDRLAKGGSILLQAITIDEAFYDAYKNSVDFIQRHIFPGGMLMTEQIMKEQLDKVGLSIAQIDKFSQHYARTLALWHDRFNETWDTVKTLGFNETFRRKWNYYLKYCQAGFAAESINVGHYKIVHSS